MDHHSTQPHGIALGRALSHHVVFERQLPERTHRTDQEDATVYDAERRVTAHSGRFDRAVSVVLMRDDGLVAGYKTESRCRE